MPRFWATEKDKNLFQQLNKMFDPKTTTRVNYFIFWWFTSSDSKNMCIWYDIMLHLCLETY